MPVVLLQARLSCASHCLTCAISFLATIASFSTQWISFKGKAKTAAEIAAPARLLHVSHHPPGAKYICIYEAKQTALSLSPLSSSALGTRQILTS